ncbi:MAG: hypothetical protein ACRCVK_08240 [Aeromonas veronii]
MIVECIAASTRRFLINSSTNQYFQFEPAHLNGFAAQAKGLPLWLEFDRDHHYGHVIGAWYQGEFLMLRAAIMRMLPPVDYYCVTPGDFVAPVAINIKLPRETTQWPGLFYPLQPGDG